MQPVFPPSGHYRPLLGFALTPDGKSAYSVGVSPVIHQWDVASTRRTRALTLPSGTARAVAVSRNGKFLAVAEEKSIHVFDCKTGRIVAHLDDHEGLITSLAFSPTEDLLVSRSMNGIVRFWDAAKHRFLASIDLGLGECPSGYLASRTIGVYSAATGERIALFSGHIDAVRQLAFSPDGAKLFSASQDTTILIWDLAEARARLGTE